MHMRDFRASLAPVRVSALLPGELGFFDMFRGILTRVQVFSNRSQCSARRCMRPAHPLSSRALLTHLCAILRL